MAESIARHELIATALELGIERPDSMSTEALSEAIRRASDDALVPGPGPGWFRVARHLVESVVAQGLNLPRAAKVLRTVGERMWSPNPRPRPPVPTVTLAQIYKSQGHHDKAHATLTRVLSRQPDNQKARTLIEQLESERASFKQAASPSTAPLSSRAEDDVVVVVQQGEGVRVFWELAAKGAELAADQGVELVVRVFQPSCSGTRVREQRYPVSTAHGARGVWVSERSFVRAALLDVHDGSTVLGVAPVFRADGRGELSLDTSFTARVDHDARARSLVTRMLDIAH